jgi:hypothetical protein
VKVLQWNAGGLNQAKTAELHVLCVLEASVREENIIL